MNKFIIILIFCEFLIFEHTVCKVIGINVVQGGRGMQLHTTFYIDTSPARGGVKG